MNIQSIFSIDSPTIVFVLGCITILVGLTGIAILALKREMNSLVTISLLVIIFGLFLVIVDRVLVQYIDSHWLNRIQIIGVALFGILYLVKNWKRN